MSEPDRAWEALAAGAAPEEALRGIDARALLPRAEAASLSDRAADRHAALAVAAAVGAEALGIARRLVRDPDPGVRRSAFDLGVARGPDGLTVLREAAAGSDPDLVVDALELLVDDKATTTRARGLLRSEDPRVRAAAARLVGHTAGRVVVAELKPLCDDPDPKVREAAAEAIARITGAATLPAVREPARPAPTPPPRGEPAGGPSAGRPAEQLLRQLGGDAQITRAALEELGEIALAQAVRTWRPGSDPALARGIARAAVILGLTSWAGTVRRLLSDPSAAVRVAALDALPRLQAGPSVLGVAANLLRDPDTSVRIAAMRSVTELGRAQGRGDLVRQRLAPLASDADPEVRRIREELLAQLA